MFFKLSFESTIKLILRQSRPGLRRWPAEPESGALRGADPREHAATTPFTHAPRFLILYGSLWERSFSRFLAYEAARLLEAMSGSVRPTQGRTLAVMQVSGGSQSFNAVNSLRLLGRWMPMITIPNQSSVPMAYKQFDDTGRMKPGPLYERVVDVCEELMKFTLLTRERADYLVDRYSERKEREPERLSAVAADIGFVKR